MSLLKNSSNTQIDSFKKSEFFKDTRTRRRFILTIVMFVLIIGLSLGALLFVTKVEKSSIEDEVTLIKKVLLILSALVLGVFIIYMVYIFVDIKHQIYDKVSERTQRLIKDYKSAYLVDYNVDSFEQIRNIDRSRKKRAKRTGFLNEINKYIDRSVYFRDRDYLKDEIEYSTIIKKLENASISSIMYREFDGITCYWTEMSFSFYSNDLLLVTIARRGNQLLQNRLIEATENDYFSLYVADLDTGLVNVLKSSLQFNNGEKEGDVISYKDVIKMMSEDESDEVKEFFEKLSDVESIKNQLLAENKIAYEYKSGEKFGESWIRVDIYVIYRNTDGSPAALSIGFSTLDAFGCDRNELKLQLRDALSMAESANKAKTIFLSNMSHDICTPMNAIVGYTSLAANHLDNIDQVEGYLGKITQTSSHLLSLINDILDMIKIESGKFIIDEHPEDLREILSSIVAICSVNVISKNIEFISNIDILNKHIVCDKVRIKQMLLNVLSNAIQFTPDYGKVSFTVKQIEAIGSAAAKYEFRIKDNGIGMTKEFQETLFEVFAKERSSTKSGVAGSGLGMTITKRILDMLNGTIEIRSLPKVGTEVIIVIPFQFSNEEDFSNNSKIEYSNADFIGTKVLVVEDNPINREITTDMLHEYGFIIECAEDGDIAVDMIKKAKEGDFDAILMDIQMPNMDGYEATKQIRALGTPISKIPIIATTANIFKEDRMAALAAGMNEHLVKPIQTERLLEILGKLLNK